MFAFFTNIIGSSVEQISYSLDCFLQGVTDNSSIPYIYLRINASLISFVIILAIFSILFLALMWAKVIDFDLNQLLTALFYLILL